MFYPTVSGDDKEEKAELPEITGAPLAAGEGSTDSQDRGVTGQKTVATSEETYEDSDGEFPSSDAVAGTSLFCGLCSNALIEPALGKVFEYIT